MNGQRPLSSIVPGAGTVVVPAAVVVKPDESGWCSEAMTGNAQIFLVSGAVVWGLLYVAKPAFIMVKDTAGNPTDQINYIMLTAIALIVAAILTALWKWK